MPEKEEINDPELERSALKTAATSEVWYWKNAHELTPDLFTADRAELLAAIHAAYEAETPPPAPDAEPLTDPAQGLAWLADFRDGRELYINVIPAAKAAWKQDVPPPMAEIVANLLEGLEHIIHRRAGVQAFTGSELLPDLLKDLDRRAKEYAKTDDPIRGIRTGFWPLDELLGGLEGKHLYLLGAETGVGKTTFALQLTRNVAARHEGIPCIYVTFENAPLNLLLKCVCAEAHMNIATPMRGYTSQEAEKLMDGARKFDVYGDRIYFIDGSAALTIEALKARTRSIMRRAGADRCLIVIDYLQTWAKQSEENIRHDSRRAVDSYVGKLVRIAKDLNASILAISSLSREKGRKVELELDAYKESGDLELSADAALMLNRSNRVSMDRGVLLDLTVKKNRHGCETVSAIELTAHMEMGRIEADEKEPKSVRVSGDGATEEMSF